MAKTKTIEIEHEEGEIVYLVTDKDQLPRVVVGYDLRRNRLRYYLNQAEEQTCHNGFEISKDRNVELATTG